MSTNYGSSVAKNGLVVCYDLTNPKSYSPNVFTYPKDAYSWASGGYQMTNTRDPGQISPVGGIPLKIVTSGASAYTGTYNSPAWNLAPAAAGQTWTFSFWVKGATAYTASLMIFEANSAGNYTTLGQIYYNVTTSWTRVSGSYTMTQGTTAYVQARIDNYNSGVTMWVDGLQLERSSSATDFNQLTNVNGSKIYSTVGNYHATINGYPSWSNGTISFNGSTNDMYFQVPATQMRTVVMLYKLPSTGLGWGPLWRSDDWKERVFPANITLIDSAGTYYTLALSTSDNVWQYVAYTYEAGKARSYKNGSLLQELTITAPWNTGTYTYYCGRQAGGSTDTRIAVDLKYLSFYDRSLSDDEIASTFNALRGRVNL